MTLPYYRKHTISRLTLHASAATSLSLALACSRQGTLLPKKAEKQLAKTGVAVAF